MGRGRRTRLQTSGTTTNDTDYTNRRITAPFDRTRSLGRLASPLHDIAGCIESFPLFVSFVQFVVVSLGLRRLDAAFVLRQLCILHDGRRRSGEKERHSQSGVKPPHSKKANRWANTARRGTRIRPPRRRGRGKRQRQAAGAAASKPAATRCSATPSATE